MPDFPIRLTKRRAAALLDLISRGIDEERASIEDEYGVHFLSDGTLEVDAELLEPGDLDGLTERIEHLTDGLAAARIFRKRYA